MYKMPDIPADVEVRRLQPQHLSEWVLIEEATFPEPWSESQLAGFLEKTRYQCFGLFQLNRLLAFCVFTTVLDEAELLQIAVMPAEQGRRLAERLFLLSAEKLRAEHVGKVLLEVRVSNSPALQLYKRLGFSEDGVRTGYYPTATGREDALLMSLSI